MTLARHCDGIDCDTWQRTNSGLAQHWLDVTYPGGDTLHFCDWNCVIKYGARFDAPEVVELG